MESENEQKASLDSCGVLVYLVTDTPHQSIWMAELELKQREPGLPYYFYDNPH